MILQFTAFSIIFQTNFKTYLLSEGDDRLSTIVNFMPQIQTMSQDCHVNVKAAVAKAVMDLAPLAGKDFTIEQLLPIFLQQLRDDSTEVRLNIIGNLSSVDSVIGMEQLASSLRGGFVEISRKWLKMVKIDLKLCVKWLEMTFFDLNRPILT